MPKDPGATLRDALKIAVSNSPRRFNQTIGGDDRLDMLRLKLPQRSSLNLALTKLKADADVAVLNSLGRVVAQSRLKGKQSETIQVPLDAGIYYIRVSPKSRRDRTRYRLTLSAGNSAPVLTKFSLTASSESIAVFDRNTFATTDAEQTPAQLIYTLTSLPQNGQLRLNGVLLNTGGQFTQADIDGSRLSYTSVGKTTRLTDNKVVDAASGISGSNVVWSSVENRTTFKGFFYNGQTGKTTQIRVPGLSGLVTIGVSGTKATGFGIKGTTAEVFLFDGATGSAKFLTNHAGNKVNVIITGTAISGNNVVWNRQDGKAFFYNDQTGKTTEMTHPGFVAAVAQGISGSKVVWLGSNGQTIEVFLFDAATGKSTRLTNNTVNEIGAAISGNNIVWNSLTGQVSKAFFYNSSTKRLVELKAPGITSAAAAAIDGDNVAWTGFDGKDNEVFLYRDATRTSTRLTNNNTNDLANGISGLNVVWTGFEGSDSDIFFYNGTTRTTKLLTNNTTNDGPSLISGSNVVWTAADGTDTEVVLRRFAASDRFSFAVSDGSGATTNGTLNITIR